MSEGTKRWMLAISGGIDAVTDWLGSYIFALMTLVLLYVVCHEVFSRYLFNNPTDWAYEITYMTYGSFFMLGAGYTLMKGGHVRTDIFYNNWSFRTRGTIDSIAYIFFFFPGMAFFFWVGLQEVAHAYETLERSDVTPWGPSLVPFKASIPIAAALLLFQGVSELIKSIYAAYTNEELVPSGELVSYD